MKKFLLQLLVVFCMSLSFMTISTSADAWCRHVAGHWQGGVWIRPHTTCWGHHNHHCKWVNPYWRHGVRVGGHKVCW